MKVLLRGFPYMFFIVVGDWIQHMGVSSSGGTSKTLQNDHF